MNSPDCPEHLLITDQWREVRHNSKYQAGMGRKPATYILLSLDGVEVDRGPGSVLESKYGLGRFTVSNGFLEGHIIGKRFRSLKVIEPKKEEADAP